MSNHEYESYLDEAALLRGLQDHPDYISDAEMLVVSAQLCDFYQDMKREQPVQSEVYLPGGEWAAYLQEQEHLYRPLLAGDQVGTISLLRNFWRNGLSPLVKQYSTYSKLLGDRRSRLGFVDVMSHDYMIWKNLLNAPDEELRIPLIGNPWGYYIHDVLIAPKALRYHVLASQIREITSDSEHPIVAEIGAGYGGTAYYLLCKDEPITYIDFDLPEVLTVAAYYLSMALPHRKVLLYRPGLKIELEAMRRYDIILMPNWKLPQLPSESVDLFLNTFSLSEMPYATICDYIAHIERCCSGYFLYNNVDREGVINRGHQRVPCSHYPISMEIFKVLYKRYDLFQRLHHGKDGDYREVLLQRRKAG